MPPVDEIGNVHHDGNFEGVFNRGYAVEGEYDPISAAASVSSVSSKQHQPPKSGDH